MPKRRATEICPDWIAGTLFLVNGSPLSRAASVWSGLKSDLPELGQAHVVLDDDRDTAVANLTAQLDRGWARLVAVGGDGTFHMAGNALARCEQPPVLGFLPGGTGSDMARNLAIPRNSRKALDALCKGQPGPIDVLDARIDGRSLRVMNDLSFGMSAAVVHHLAARPASKRAKHKASYLTGALAQLTRFTAPAVSMQIDGETVHQGQVLLAAISNGAWFGNGLKVAPGASICDGLLDLTWGEAQPRYRLPVLMLALLRARHLKRRDVHQRAGQVVVVRATSEPVLLEADGEALRFSELEVRIHRHAQMAIYPWRRNHSPE